jgi:hypothetical protein
MIDLVFRAFSKARWVTVATNRGILNAQGTPNPGFEVDEIGAAVIADAIVDAQGNITTPAVMDTWFLVNLRIHGAEAVNDNDTLYAGETEDGFKFTKSKLAKFVRDQATLVNLTFRGATVRTYQFGLTTNRIQLLDPRDYGIVRVREWLGGMSY